MSKKEEKFRVEQLERKVGGMQDTITSLKTDMALTKAELTEYKKRTTWPFAI